MKRFKLFSKTISVELLLFLIGSLFSFIGIWLENIQQREVFGFWDGFLASMTLFTWGWIGFLKITHKEFRMPGRKYEVERGWIMMISAWGIALLFLISGLIAQFST